MSSVTSMSLFKIGHEIFQHDHEKNLALRKTRLCCKLVNSNIMFNITV